MSLLRGDPDSERNLAHAADRMAAAAREGARPGWIWVAGFVYQNLNLGWAFSVVVGWPVLSAALPEAERVFGYLAGSTDRPLGEVVRILAGNASLGTVTTLLLFPVLFRLLSGLAAQLAVRDREGHPTLRRAWRAGKGMWRSAAGLWLQVVLMMLGAALLFVGPTSALVRFAEIQTDELLGVFLTGICIALILFYGFVLTILFQIGLHSLVRNRRGVGSALLHSWRIVRADPGATARAGLVDLALLAGLLVVWALYGVAATIAGVLLPDLVELFLALPELALLAIAGFARCAYWARTYEVLGGLSTGGLTAGADEVAGLAPGA